MKYYVKTIAYMWFVPLFLLIAVSFCRKGIISVCIKYFGLVYHYTDNHPAVTAITSFVFIVLCFLAAMRYGYFSAKKIYNAPGNRADMYMPVFFPMVWYLLWTAVMNVFDVRATELLGLAIQCIVTLNPYGYNAFTLLILFLPWDVIEAISSSTDVNHLILFCSMLYYALLIIGFAVGERLYARKTEGAAQDQYKPLVSQKKKIIIFFVVVTAVYSLSEFVLYQRRINIVPSAHTSYGFAYEGGYSSTDLEPYYVENKSNILAKLDEPSAFMIYNPIDMPILDGAEAAYPVYSAFANACYADIADIQTYGKEQRTRGTVDEDYIVMPIKFTNTIRAYERLLDGEVDICFGAKPSEEQLQMAEDAGKEVILTPIGKEGFVFFVNEANPVSDLSSEQLKGIYSGKIKNWRKVGGENEEILAFQRPENSGSQTMMEYFMGDTPLKKPLETEYHESMGGVLKGIAAYDNGSSSIGYSFRYFAALMAEEDSGESDTASDEKSSGSIKFLAVDGVYPDEDTIRSGEYPLTTQLYAITVIDKHSPTGTYSKDTIEPFLEWMTGPQGQKIVADTGYVSLE